MLCCSGFNLTSTLHKPSELGLVYSFHIRVLQYVYLFLEVACLDLATRPPAGEAPSELYESVVVGLLDKNKRGGQPQRGELKFIWSVRGCYAFHVIREKGRGMQHV